MKKFFKYGDKTVEVSEAAGVTGVLCWSPSEENYFLRVKDDSHEDGYVDYYLRHSDLTVTICHSEEASFYRTDCNEGTGVLDHAPETLGLEQVNEPDTKS